MPPERTTERRVRAPAMTQQSLSSPAISKPIDIHPQSVNSPRIACVIVHCFVHGISSLWGKGWPTALNTCSIMAATTLTTTALPNCDPATRGAQRNL